VLRVVEYPDARRLDPAWEQARRPGQVVAMPGFLRAFESGGIEGVTLTYLGVYDGPRFLGGAAFSRAAFGLDLLAPKALRVAADRVRGYWPGFARLRSTTCGVWASQGGNEVVFADPEARGLVIDRIAERAEALARSGGANVVVFKEFRTEETTVWDRLQRHGYVRLHSLPFASLEIRWRTFDEYLHSLRAGYRRQARANLAKRDLPGVTLDLAERLEDHADELHPLYLQVMDHTEFHIETLTPAFFAALGRELGPAVRLVSLRRRGELLGGAVMTVDGDRATFLYAGFDYARLREHDTYGQLSSRAKTRMGARMSEVFAYARGRGVPMAPIVQHLGRQLYPPHPMPVRHVFK
jgi:hypothetical protein